MAEWSNAAVLKTVELARVPGVRIPLSPLKRGVPKGNILYCAKRLWRDARVVEWGGLENRCTLSSTGGSNPFLSATKRVKFPSLFFVFSPSECLHSEEVAENKKMKRSEASFLFVARPPAVAQGSVILSLRNEKSEVSFTFFVLITKKDTTKWVVSFLLMYSPLMHQASVSARGILLVSKRKQEEEQSTRTL